jgi:SAM-dependent methyltransferase
MSTDVEGVAVLPFPPEEMRRLVALVHTSYYDNPSGALVFRGLPAEAYDSVLDFGCGCGRIGRQLIQQTPRPRHYLGIDLHEGMVRWCQQNLAPLAPGFRFEHHDVYHRGLNPLGARGHLPFPASDRSFSLVNAWSVFTHVMEDQARHYLAECARVLKPEGFLHATWFLFDKSGFPMMQEFQNALFINDQDPTNAVIFDRGWLMRTAAEVGLKLVAATTPKIRGYQWILVMAHVSHPLPAIPLPEDHGPIGVNRPPQLPPDAEKIGRNG